MLGVEPPRPLIARPPDRPPPVAVNPGSQGWDPQQEPARSGPHQAGSGQQGATGSRAQGDCSTCAASNSATASVAPALGAAPGGTCPSGVVQGLHGQQTDQIAAAADSHAAPDRDWADLQPGDSGSAVTHLLTQRFMPHRQIAAIRADGSISVWRQDGVGRTGRQRCRKCLHRASLHVSAHC